MAKPDTRKRDRAAYMRDYRAKRAKANPSLLARIEALEARVALIDGVKLEHGDRILVKDQPPESLLPNGTYVVAASGRSRPSPKAKAR